MTEHFSIAIIGAGPAGLSAAAHAATNGMSYILFEKSEIGNTIFDYQLRKHVMAEPAKLPLRGEVTFTAASREKILADWNAVIARKSLHIRKSEVTKIKRAGAGFEIFCGETSYSADKVVLGMGIQGSPRRLGVPGDDLPHIAYTLSDPAAFKGRTILVVGAGDSAIENALGLMDNNFVSILNRSAEFPRAKEANAAKITAAIKSGKIRCFSNSALIRILPDVIYINTPDGEVEAKCDHIIARLGCIPPRKFMEGCGIVFPNDDMNAVPVVDNKYQSNVPELYVIGSLIGYPLIKQGINQGFEVIEHILGRPVEPADQVLIEERLRGLPAETSAALAQLRSALTLFADLSDAQFRELLIESTVHIKEEGDIIFERNDYTDTFYSVVSGTVDVAISPVKSVEMNGGDFFGEMGLLSGRRRSATVTAQRKSILLETPRKQILKLLNSVAGVKRKIDEAFVLRALQTSIFPEAAPEFLAGIASKVRTKNFKKGEVLFREGDPGDILYVIRKGSVKISRLNSTGSDVAQTYLPAGNFVGEMALLTADTKPRSATVSAAVACETILIEKSDFIDLLEHAPQIKDRLNKLAREREVENLTVERDEYRGKLLDFLVADGVTDADNFLLIDSDLCIACDNCEKACAANHHGYSLLDRKGGKTFASVQIPICCRHCENPLCMTDCPPDALVRMQNGEVFIRDCCIGCGNCVRNCPYGVMQLIHEHQENHGLFSFLRKASTEEGPAVAAKCDMCSRCKGGPACVQACPTGAIVRIRPKEMLELVADKRGADQ